MAVSHGLAPLLFKRLKESGARSHVPADAWEQLQFHYLRYAGTNTRLYRQLAPVLRALRSAGIKVIVLKGVHLAEAVYGDVAVRPMSDIDLMVPKVDLPKAQAVLLGLGAVHRQFEDIESCCERKPHLPQLVIRDLPIEIHWTIVSPTGPFRVDVAGLWDRARPATIAGVDVLSLSPGDLLLHLCLHTCHTNGLYGGLRPFTDIAATIRRFRPEIDWAQLGRTAREWGAARQVGLTLHLARSLQGAGVPDDVLEALVPGGIDRRVIEAAEHSVFAGIGYSEWMPFFKRVDATSLGDKARLSWKRIFLSRDEMAATYPSYRNVVQLPWYYARRVGHVVRSYAIHSLRRGWLAVRSRGRDRKAPLVNWLKSGEP